MKFSQLRLLTLCLLTGLVSLPLDFFSDTKAVATDNVIQLASANSAFQQYMNTVYRLTNQKQYQAALRYFQAALRISPGNKYAIGAIRNVERYIQRANQKTPPTTVAISNKSGFDKYMRHGYKATKNRNYKTAKRYFQKALKQRPGNRYARAAIRNMNAYLGRTRTLAFAPSRPRRRGAGVTRGTYILPITPTNQTAQLTTSNNPKLFFYIRESETRRELKLVLRDGSESGAIIGEKTFTHPGKKGIVSVTLPGNQLKIGQEYHWTFTMIDSDPDGFDKNKSGTIMRVEEYVDLTNQIQQTTNSLDKVRLYAMAELWENSLTTLMDLRQQRPNDKKVQESYEELLESVKLTLNQPLIGNY